MKDAQRISLSRHDFVRSVAVGGRAKKFVDRSVVQRKEEYWRLRLRPLW